MVAHPFVSEVLITTVHKLMLLCTKGCTDTKGCVTMRCKPRWVNPYIKRKL